MDVVAHRGYAAVAPENTLAAIEAAVAAGAHWIEFDVRTSADGVPVVIHDRSLDRTTDGAGEVSERTLDELRRRDAGSWFSPAFAGQRIPTLAQVLDLLAARGPQVLLEVKRPAGAEQLKAILTEVVDRGLTERVVVQSFGDQILRDVRSLVPELRRGVLRDGLDPDPVGTARELGAVMYNPSVADVLAAPRIVADLSDAGVQVMPWTANETAEWAALAAAGVGGIITDRPGGLLGWRAGRAADLG